jgi:hypothetical protein
MGSFNHVAVEIVIHENGASDRSYSDCSFRDLEMVESFSYEAMGDPVAASRAVVHYFIVYCLWFGEYWFHFLVLCGCDNPATGGTSGYLTPLALHSLDSARDPELVERQVSGIRE